MSPPVITLLTDYGVADHYVGVLHGVIVDRCPAARIIDLSHGIALGDVFEGALALADALAYLPIGVHVAVVDPGVGTDRDAVAVATADGRRFVGPDNGVLSLAVAAAGGAVAAVELSRSPFRIEPVSATFHGRDLFAPVAAALSAGCQLSEVGDDCAVDGLVELALDPASAVPGGIELTIAAVDRGFGNLSLWGGPSDLPFGMDHGTSVRVEAGGRQRRATVGRTFADVAHGELVLHVDSAGRLALAINRGDAFVALEVMPGDRIRLIAE